MVQIGLVEDFVKEMSKAGEYTNYKHIAEKFGISPQQARRHLHRLSKLGKIREIKRGKRGLIFYVHEKYFPKHVDRIIEWLRKKYRRNPTLEEIAIEMKIPVERAKEQVYEVAKEVGWREPTQEEIEEGRKEAYRILITAAYLNLKRSSKGREYLWQIKKHIGKFEELFNEELIERAKEYIRKFREFVPKIEIIEIKEKGKGRKKLDVRINWPEKAYEVIGKPKRKYYQII